MRVNIVGGGPAGLYSAILIQKAFPSCSIDVVERNQRGDTFGFGVVFSDETLAGFHQADAESHDAITRRFARWDAIDVHVKGRKVRSRGHGFCGIGRRELLSILESRALELGVRIHHGTEGADLATLRRADVLVAADGLRSATRNELAEHFRPSLDGRRCRYIWLGTKQRFEAFTFSFRETPHGLFQIHAYQYDSENSTVIVECHEDTFRRAGLDRATESESIAFCQSVFAGELGGNPLVSNRSAWIQFPTLRCERWAHENVVLIGDAAHTAHFSIGSGTKLAMEDAIALTAALVERGAPEDALEAYDRERRSVVGRVQTAAQQSLEWFESTDRLHRALPVEEFVFGLLTRSRRITHANLALRDPELVAGCDRAYAVKSGLSGGAPPLFTPLRVGAVELANRVVVSPMCMYSAVDGVPGDFHLVHYGSRAQGGAGLLFTEMTNIHADGRITPGCTGLWNEAQLVAWKRIVEFVHTTQARMGLQLSHAGRKGSTRPIWEGMDSPLTEGGWEVIGPSAIPYDPARSPVPRAMTRADMDTVLEGFLRSTELARRAGFDLLELHMAHGYLLSSFLSPLSNVRTDAYGGSPENRLRFPLEVLDAVRARWEGPLCVRISAVDWAPGGLTIEESVQIAKALVDHGADLLDVSTGQTSSEARPVFGRAYQTPFAERIRNELGVPVITVGNIGDADQANTILLSGRADLIALGRPHLADPFFTLHAAAALQHPVVWPKQYAFGAPPSPTRRA